jgi:hypothetical protein
MSHIQPIIDLWTMRPFAYALVDSAGNPYESGSPHELYQLIDIAYFRDFTPLIVMPVDGMLEIDSWIEFTKEFPDMLIYRYFDRVVHGNQDETLLTDEGPVNMQWVRDVTDAQTLENLQKKSVRFGSGEILAGPVALPMPKKRKQSTSKNDVVTVQWA